MSGRTTTEATDGTSFRGMHSDSTTNVGFKNARHSSKTLLLMLRYRTTTGRWRTSNTECNDHPLRSQEGIPSRCGRCLRLRAKSNEALSLFGLRCIECERCLHFFLPATSIVANETRGLCYRRSWNRTYLILPTVSSMLHYGINPGPPTDALRHGGSRTYGVSSHCRIRRTANYCRNGDHAAVRQTISCSVDIPCQGECNAKCYLTIATTCCYVPVCDPSTTKQERLQRRQQRTEWWWRWWITGTSPPSPIMTSMLLVVPS
jgi:hypothetical protein